MHENHYANSVRSLYKNKKIYIILQEKFVTQQYRFGFQSTECRREKAGTGNYFFYYFCITFPKKNNVLRRNIFFLNTSTYNYRK